MPVESPPSTSQRRRFADENHWDREDFSFDVFDFANRLKDGFRYLYELLNWWNLRNHSTSRYSRHPTKLTLRFISDSIYSLEVFPPKSFGNFPVATHDPWFRGRSQRISRQIGRSRIRGLLRGGWPSCRSILNPVRLGWLLGGIGERKPWKIHMEPEKNGGLECLEDHFPISSWWYLGSMMFHVDFHGC